MRFLAKKPGKRAGLTDYDAVEKEVLGSFPQVRKLWDETEPRRRMSMMLIGLRKAASLSQKQVAERAGWDKAFVSRLESARGSIPDATTVARYAAVCGATAGIVVGQQSDSGYLHIIDAVTLRFEAGGNGGSSPFERLRDANVELGEEEATR